MKDVEDELSIILSTEISSIAVLESFLFLFQNLKYETSYVLKYKLHINNEFSCFFPLLYLT
jgi:hypothetical protein